MTFVCSFVTHDKPKQEVSYSIWGMTEDTLHFNCGKFEEHHKLRTTRQEPLKSASDFGESASKRRCIRSDLDQDKVYVDCEWLWIMKKSIQQMPIGQKAKSGQISIERYGNLDTACC